MEDFEKVKEIIAKNLIFFRKRAKLTQGELAEKINYSDKAVSKWERAEGVPDIFVLSELAKIYGITVDTILKEDAQNTEVVERHIDNKKKHVIITILACCIVWLVATVLFVFPIIILKEPARFWLAFIYAIPATFIVLVVFNSIWGRRVFNAIYVSFLNITMCLALYLSIPIGYMWMIFLIAIPIEIMIILWYLIKK